MFQVYLPKFIVNFSWEEVVISISFIYSPWVGTPEIKRKEKKKEGDREEGRNKKKSDRKVCFKIHSELCGKESCGRIFPC